MSKLIIRIERGFITSVSGVVKGTEVEVRDYDCEGADEDSLHQDTGGEYYETYEPGIVEHE